MNKKREIRKAMRQIKRFHRLSLGPSDMDYKAGAIMHRVRMGNKKGKNKKWQKQWGILCLAENLWTWGFNTLA